MIEKSRLEKLIKQKATVYYADREVNAPIPIFLNEEDFVKKDDLSHEESCVRDNIALEDLFETYEQAEWQLEFGNITRTETLSLPTYSEFIKLSKGLCFSYKPYDYKMEYIDEKFALGRIRISRFYGLGGTDLFNEIATEENYIKACDLCVKLFKGESDENN